MQTAPDALMLGRLRWRCRRGLLENDLLIERFLARHGETLDQAQATALLELMELDDTDLLDLLLARREPDAALAARPGVAAVLGLMRAAANPSRKAPNP